MYPGYRLEQFGAVCQGSAEVRDLSMLRQWGKFASQSRFIYYRLLVVMKWFDGSFEFNGFNPNLHNSGTSGPMNNVGSDLLRSFALKLRMQIKTP